MSKAAADSPSFEQALLELEKIVRELESGKADLESSIAAFERGSALRKVCEAKLQEARMRIEKISVQDGRVLAEPFSQKE